MKEEKGKFPGWAVKFEDGTWLASAHGLHRFEDASYAKLYDSWEDARYDAEYYRKDYPNDSHVTYDVIPGWEPLCEQLRSEVSNLEKTNKISWMDIFEIATELESIAYKLHGKIE